MKTEQQDTPRQQRNARRVRQALRNHRLWFFSKNRWVESTFQPLQWFANKCAGSKVARVKRKCGA